MVLFSDSFNNKLPQPHHKTQEALPVVPSSPIAYHGVMYENAKEGDAVELDFPIRPKDRSMLTGGK